MEAILNQVNFLFATYPWLKHAAAGYIMLRVINKPLFMAFHKYVQLSDSAKDNKIYQKIVDSKTYKMVTFILDLGLSIKLPKK